MWENPVMKKKWRSDQIFIIHINPLLHLKLWYFIDYYCQSDGDKVTCLLYKWELNKFVYNMCSTQRTKKCWAQICPSEYTGCFKKKLCDNLINIAKILLRKILVKRFWLYLYNKEKQMCDDVSKPSNGTK